MPITERMSLVHEDHELPGRWLSVHPGNERVLILQTCDGAGMEDRPILGQRPYGDFTPGRYAWLLEDVKPTTERCPTCTYPTTAGLVACGVNDLGARTVCPTCDGTGRCDPVPARGRQGLWEWKP